MGDLRAASRRIREGMERAISAGIGSGMAASFGRIDDLLAGREPLEIYAGRTSLVPGSDEVGPRTVFDCASLTKILATTLLAMKRFEEGLFGLDSKPFAGLEVTPRQLLLHASGLPAWKPFYEALIREFGTGLQSVPPALRAELFFRELEAVGPEADPGLKIVYSDLGFLRLGRFLSQDLWRDCADLWFRVPGLGLHFRPVIRPALEERMLARERGESVAMTELCPWRGLLSGQVHDDNAYSLGGVAGHAGVFGSLPDLHRWIRGLFSGAFVSMKTLREFSTPWSDGQGGVRALGFDCPSSDGSGSTGRAFSSRSIGHLGFTGTSLWMDLLTGSYAILLTNRVHPDRNDVRIREFRRDFHEELRQWL